MAQRSLSLLSSLRAHLAVLMSRCMMLRPWMWCSPSADCRKNRQTSSSGRGARRADRKAWRLPRLAYSMMMLRRLALSKKEPW